MKINDNSIYDTYIVSVRIPDKTVKYYRMECEDRKPKDKDLVIIRYKTGWYATKILRVYEGNVLDPDMISNRYALFPECVPKKYCLLVNVYNGYIKRRWLKAGYVKPKIGDTISFKGTDGEEYIGCVVRVVSFKPKDGFFYPVARLNRNSQKVYWNMKKLIMI